MPETSLLFQNERKKRMIQKVDKESSYYDFVREFCNCLSEITGIPETSFHLKASEGETFNSSDVENVVIDTTEVNNTEETRIPSREESIEGTYAKEKKCDQLYIDLMEMGDMKEICKIQTEELYRLFLAGKSIRQIAKDLAEQIRHSSSEEILRISGKMKDYNEIKEYLFIRLLNMDNNKEELKQCVYRQVGDIALTLYVKVDEKESMLFSAKVPRDVVSIWQKDPEKVIDEALVNTYFISPPRIYFWEKMLVERSYEGENFMNIFWKESMNRDPVGNCLSTVKKTNGAVAIFLPGVARRIASLLQDDLYLAFTSVHEVMVHAAGSVSPTELKEVLCDTLMSSTDKNERLSFHIFRYDREAASFECLTE